MSFCTPGHCLGDSCVFQTDCDSSLVCLNDVCSESYLSMPTGTSLVTPAARNSLVIVAGAAVAALVVIAVIISAVVWIFCRRRARRRQLAGQAAQPAQANSYAFQQPVNTPAAPYKSPYPPSVYPPSPFLGGGSPAPSYVSTPVGGQKPAWPIQPLPSTTVQTFELDAIPSKDPALFELDSGDTWSPLESKDTKKRRK